MPHVLPKKAPPESFEGIMGDAVGDARDFVALAYCFELDEIQKETDRDHDEFTFVFRYRSGERALLAKYPRRLEGIWRRADGAVLVAGNTAGLVHIGAEGVVEAAIPNHRGIFSAIWCAGDEHVFAVGGLPAFAYYWRHGTLFQLPLPEGTESIHDVYGFAENDVYFVGEGAQVHHFDGARVTRLRVPVREHLNGVVRFGPQEMCICGYHGSLLVGRGARWRHIVTETTEPLLSVGMLGDRVYYGADDAVWASDGKAPVVPVLPFAASWVAGLSDGLVVSNGGQAKLYAGGSLSDLEMTISRT
ncbi:MAG TPA: hypothetical protein VK841_04865 [Polyangiaceae bacterium]|jgi:hypothetical protein|nr:hypothetical protein [Polyangiaceae bacterium]